MFPELFPPFPILDICLVAVTKYDFQLIGVGRANLNLLLVILRLAPPKPLCADA